MVPVRWRRIRIKKRNGATEAKRRTFSRPLQSAYCLTTSPFLCSLLPYTSHLFSSSPPFRFLILVPLWNLAGINDVSVSQCRVLVRQRHTLSSKSKHGCSAFSSSSHRVLFLQIKTGPIGISPYWFGMCCSSFSTLQ